MKKSLLCFVLLLCLLPVGVLAEGTIEITAEDIGTQGGFNCLPDYAWGAKLEEVLPGLTDAEKFDPESESFEWNRFRENPLSKEATVTPVETYRLGNSGDELTLQLEFNGEQELYAYWLISETIPADGLTQEAFDAMLGQVKNLHDALSEGRETLLISAPADWAEADRAYLEENGLRIFYIGGDGTFCQLNCTFMQSGELFYNIGVGLVDEMPAIGRIIENAKTE